MNTKYVTIYGTKEPTGGKITLPASKSHSNRVLMLKAYSGASFGVENLSEADDVTLLRNLLAAVRESEGARERVRLIDCGNAGTVLRFLLPYLAQKEGNWLLDGSDRMRQRPVGTLVEALRQLGADLQYAGTEGYPPINVIGKRLKGGIVTIDGSESSQFGSALLMAGAFMPGGLRLEITGSEVSLPYLAMTIKTMEYFGLTVKKEGNVYSVDNGEIEPNDIEIEPDWSSASYHYTLVALSSKGRAQFNKLAFTGLQGDEAVAGLFHRLGVTTKQTLWGLEARSIGILSPSIFSYDFRHHPDLAMTMAVACAGLGTGAMLSGLENLRIKESDRLEGLITELRRLGVETDYKDETLQLSGSVKGHMAGDYVRTYGDHRFAMAFAPLAQVLGKITIENPAVVSKSYPSYWEDLLQLGPDMEFHD